MSPFVLGVLVGLVLEHVILWARRMDSAGYAIYGYVRKTGSNGWFSYAEVGSALRLSRVTFDVALRAMEKNGWIERKAKSELLLFRVIS